MIHWTLLIATCRTTYDGLRRAIDCELPEYHLNTFRVKLVAVRTGGIYGDVATFDRTQTCNVTARAGSSHPSLEPHFNLKQQIIRQTTAVVAFLLVGILSSFGESTVMEMPIPS